MPNPTCRVRVCNSEVVTKVSPSFARVVGTRIAIQISRIPAIAAAAVRVLQAPSLAFLGTEPVVTSLALSATAVVKAVDDATFANAEALIAEVFAAAVALRPRAFRHVHLEWAGTVPAGERPICCRFGLPRRLLLGQHRCDTGVGGRQQPWLDGWNVEL